MRQSKLKNEANVDPKELEFDEHDEELRKPEGQLA